MYFNAAAISQNGAMGAEPISKNGQSSKSQTSRGNWKLFAFFILSTSTFLLSSCSSPESDGIKAAQMKYDLQADYYKKSSSIAKEFIKERVQAYELYIGKFDSYAFTTRIDAREKINENLENIGLKEMESSQKLLEAARESEKKFFEYYETLRNKYATNKEKLEKFNYAGEHYQPKERVQLDDLSDYQNKLSDFQEKVESLILSIIPPKPDLEQMKNDLIGRTINNQTKGYPDWKINSLDELKDIETLNTNDNTTNNGYEYLLDIHQILQGEANKWGATMNIKYVLQKYDDRWKLVTFDSQMNIVRTSGKYDNCITSRLITEGGWGAPQRHIEFSNSCDVNILVSGELTQSSLGRRYSREFNIQVPANGKKILDHNVINQSTILYVNSYDINFIELAGL